MDTISRRAVIQSLAATAIPKAIWTAGAASATSVPSESSRPTNPPVIEQIRERFRSFPFESQQIGGVFAERMRTNLEARLLEVDEADILKGYVFPRVPVESFAGEHAGMFLDAAANVLRSTGSTRLKALADHTAAALLATQGSDGYLGSYAPGRHLTGVDVWIHKWNLIGLLSYYEATGEAKYLAACRKAADLLCRTFGEAPDQRDLIANAEFNKVAPFILCGDMFCTAILEPMCRLYRLTGEPRYLDFAQYVIRAYTHPQGPDIVRSILKHGSVAAVSTGHAYLLLANFNGILDLYRLTGQEELLAVVLRAWEDIRLNQLYITGAMGSGACGHEAFRPDGLLLSLFSSNVGETCATVTWLEFNWRLLRLTGEARFGQEIERALYNQLLAAQDPHNGDISYYTSLTGHKEWKSDIVCCLSNGARGISLIPQWVWGLEQNAFVVNLYTAGTVSFELKGAPVQVVSQTEFPRDGNVTLKINPERDTAFTVRLRVPVWARRFEVSSGAQTLQGTPGKMLDITQTWTRNSVLEIRMELAVRTLPGGTTYPDYVALQRGPQILALERRLNPDVPYLERTALAQSAGELSVTPVQRPLEWVGRQVYEVDGIALKPGTAGELVPERSRLRFVPFADAVEYRVWTTRPEKLPRNAPAVTAFARATASAQPYRVISSHDSTEALTDDNPETFCMVDPTVVGYANYARGLTEVLAPISMPDTFKEVRKVGKRGDPVWFAVSLERPETISRVTFRHGPTAEEGGWFYTSGGKPRIEITRVPYGELRMQKDSDWVTVATIEGYPDVDSDSLPRLTDRQVFEIRLPMQVRVYGIRIVGRPARNYVTCSELSAY